MSADRLDGCGHVMVQRHPEVPCHAPHESLGARMAHSAPTCLLCQRGRGRLAPDRQPPGDAARSRLGSSRGDHLREGDPRHRATVPQETAVAAQVRGAQVGDDLQAGPCRVRPCGKADPVVAHLQDVALPLLPGLDLDAPVRAPGEGVFDGIDKAWSTYCVPSGSSGTQGDLPSGTGPLMRLQSP
jgi:hypothetical protein